MLSKISSFCRFIGHVVYLRPLQSPPKPHRSELCMRLPALCSPSPPPTRTPRLPCGPLLSAAAKGKVKSVTAEPSGFEQPGWATGSDGHRSENAETQREYESQPSAVALMLSWGCTMSSFCYCAPTWFPSDTRLRLAIVSHEKVHVRFLTAFTFMCTPVCLSLRLSMCVWARVGMAKVGVMAWKVDASIVQYCRFTSVV